MGDDARQRLERLVEVTVFAPLGLAMTLRDMAPTFVNMFVSRGRAEVDRRQQSGEQRVKTLKSTGEVALAFGVPMIRDKVAGALGRSAGAASTEAAEAAAVADDTGEVAPRPKGATEPRPETPPSTPSPKPAIALVPDANGTGDRTGDTGDTGPAVGDLPIPGYDELSASHVVERLVGLSERELATVRDYEGAHRNRRTILCKIDQLAQR